MELRNSFIEEVKKVIEDSRVKAIRSVDHIRVRMYWELGRKIVEEEQSGNKRANYGRYLILSLSQQLTTLYGQAFNKRQLERYRQFYRFFPIASALRTQFSWTHYKTLLSIENQLKRQFYEAEAAKNIWSSRELERQINSHLYERLLLSNEPESLLSVARSEKQPEDVKEIIKDPMVLEFLGLRQESVYYEKDLESKIITHLQEFLLELGNGFAFMSRQKRIHLEGDDFFIDLVLYNRLLQCFVIIEIKTGKITHQDIGQLQMYVNYYDRYEKKEFENATIGILLCADKNEAVVKITLPENNQTIIATRYQLYLPTEEQLLEELKKIK
jgi:predicted nuclease of restriction endonuclease-like (RecB) superfamily